MKRSSRTAAGMTADLFESAAPHGSSEALDDGATILRGFARADARLLIEEVEGVVAISPFRHLTTPGGYRMSVAMTNCGARGWTSDCRGYRYDPLDPLTGQPWPAMPTIFRELAASAAARAGYARFEPDACLINSYEAGARLSLHQDRDERDIASPIVSVSLGLPAIFLWGGLRRSDKVHRTRLDSGDVVVWGGASRFVFHGVAPLADGVHTITGPYRINLTFRRAGGN